MKKIDYIKICKNRIAESKKILAGPNEDKNYHNNALFWIFVSNRLLTLFGSDNINIVNVELLFEEVYDKSNYSYGVPYAPSFFFVSAQFSFLYKWAKEYQLVTEKIRKWKIELFTKEIVSMQKYLDNLIEKTSKEIRLATSISNKWLNLLNSSFVTQDHIDSILDFYMNYKDLGDIEVFWSIGYQFRDWAELEGFEVISEKELKDHFDDVVQKSY